MVGAREGESDRAVSRTGFEGAVAGGHSLDDELEHPSGQPDLERVLRGDTVKPPPATKQLGERRSARTVVAHVAVPAGRNLQP